MICWLNEFDSFQNVGQERSHPLELLGAYLSEI